MTRTLVSVVAPVHNEEAVIEEFVRRTQTAIEPLAEEHDFELILIDDGSDDGSLERMKALALADPRLRVIELRRRYGQTHALQAGLDAARGEILITLDADLQHFPEGIPQFLAKLREGYDMVCGWRHERVEGVVRRWPSRVANLLVRWVSGLAIHDVGTTYRAYRAELVKELRLFGEFHRFIPALGHGVGARITEIPIRNAERRAGRSSYGLGRTLGVLLDLVVLFFLVRYLDRPMRVFGKVAALCFAGGMAILITLIVYAYTCNIPTVREHSGWFLMSLMLLLASVQILLAGILAEILVRVHFAQGDRRVYQVRREWSAARREP